MLPEVVVQSTFGTPIRLHPTGFANDEPRHLRYRRFTILSVHPVVADQRIGHGHQLTRVRGIRENLLIPGHRRVEDDLTEGDGIRTEQSSVESTSVLEQEVGCVVQGGLLLGLGAS